MISSSASTLVLIDGSVDDYQSLMQGVDSNAAVVLLDPNHNGIDQISQTLDRHRGVSSVHIVSHGSEGSLQLGATLLNANTLSTYAKQIRQWAATLANRAEILLYGCQVAAGESGEAFVRQLSQLTGAAIAASRNLTGNAAKGGDWKLTYQTGAITSLLAFQPEALAAYAGVLRTFNVNSFAALVDAIQQANGNSEDDVIQINGNITLAGVLPVISSNIVFEGNSQTISGADTYQIFRVSGGNVRFENLTIANGKAQGANGVANSGSAGGVGQGGGLFIGQGNVTLVNSTLAANKAWGGNGGTSLTGAGGKGGDGQGGAIYVGGGSLRLSNTNLRDNQSRGGSGGTGSTNGTGGLGKGGAIYLGTGATVIAEGNPSFSRNQAANDSGVAGDDDNVFGTLNIVMPPKVMAIAPAQTGLTADAKISYLVTFDQDVQGLDISDFELVTDGTIANANIASMAGSGKTYTVEVNTGTGDGNLRLDLKDDDTIHSSADVPLGATGLSNGDFTGGTYQIYKTPPKVFAINRKSAVLTAADAVAYRVIFDVGEANNVTGVDAQDFAVSGNGITGASVTSVKQIDGRTFDVVLNSGTGNGQLGLNLVDNDSIRNNLGVTLGGTGNSNGNFVGQVYTIDKTPPVVASINRSSGNPTNAGTVNYTIAFSQNVSGVDRTDFSLTPNGVQGASITSVTTVDAKTYTIAVNTGSNDGTLRLNLQDNDSISNALGVALGGKGTNNGNFNGQVYTLLKNAPRVSAITRVNPNPTAAGNVNYAVTFSQDVTGVDASDFGLSAVDIAGARITAVTGSGRNYNVQVGTGGGSGTLRLDLLDNDSIRNAVNTALGGQGAGNGNFNGQSYTINKTPPRVTAINRLEANPTNAANITFAVIFNENVLRVDAADFALASNGVTGASIASVTRVNGSFYTVEVATGRGNGTVGLNLVDNDSILNTFGTPLGGSGRGNFTGEVYTIDKINPTAQIVNVSPNPRRDKVNTLTFTFTEAVAGFDRSDLRLTRDGAAVDLSRATLTSADGINWTLGNIKKLTNQKGEYNLLLAANDSGIRDAAGNPLAANTSERWTNLVTVDACDPGIFSRGTNQADTLTGTEDKDTLLGNNGNDALIGLDCGDRLVGDRGNDVLDGGSDSDVLIGGTGADILIGGAGQDTLKGGPGRDRFVFSGATQADALATSLTDAPDRIQDFKFDQKDKIQLDFNNNLNDRDRPRGLFNAGQVNGRNLQAAARSAYDDKNQTASGNQSLGANEAVFFKWKNRTYLSVNDRSAGFANDRDLMVNVTGIQFKPGDANAGVLTVNNYFI
ncbi:MAG: hypothetical protein Kow00121_46020 [Elainellaceae cyanobacterium]